MSSVTRLWRRAPTWRFCLFSAIAMTVLAVLFPPTVPHWRHPAASAGARYTPSPAGPPISYGMLAGPPLGQTRSGTMAFAGRQLPLPVGAWQALVLGRTGGADAVQVMVLARTDGSALTGLMMAIAPGPVSGAVGVSSLPELCFTNPRIAGAVMSAGTTLQSPLVHECWVLTSIDTAGVHARGATDDALHNAFARLDRLGIAVPARLLLLRYFRSSDTGWQEVRLFLPGAPSGTRPATGRWSEWGAMYASQLHRGYDGTLAGGDLTAPVAADPG